MLIEVIPLGGSIDDRALTYFVSDDLAQSIRLGCLVEVPFHNALDYALVTGSENLPRGNGWLREDFQDSENLKSISRVVTPIPLLEKYQIDTIFSLSSYYLVRPHQVLSIFLNKSLVRYFEKTDFSGFQLKERSSDIYPESIYFHHHTDPSPIVPVISDHLSGRTVVVFPDDYPLEAYIKSNPQDSETLVIPDRLTETKKHKAFRDAYNGEKNIIIWTRRILYYNLGRYDNIIYVEDSLHRSLMRFQHTYKHLEILRRMAPGHFSTTILSTLPSVESMYLLHSGVYTKSEPLS